MLLTKNKKTGYRFVLWNLEYYRMKFTGILGIKQKQTSNMEHFELLSKYMFSYYIFWIICIFLKSLVFFIFFAFRIISEFSLKCHGLKGFSKAKDDQIYTDFGNSANKISNINLRTKLRLLQYLGEQNVCIHIIVNITHKSVIPWLTSLLIGPCIVSFVQRINVEGVFTIGANIFYFWVIACWNRTHQIKDIETNIKQILLIKSKVTTVTLKYIIIFSPKKMLESVHL